MADLFNLKVQAVRDLAKNLNKEQTYFINKRKAEIRRVLEQAAIAGVLQYTINTKQSIWSVKQIQIRVK